MPYDMGAEPCGLVPYCLRRNADAIADMQAKGAVVYLPNAPRDARDWMQDTVVFFGYCLRRADALDVAHALEHPGLVNVVCDLDAWRTEEHATWPQLPVTKTTLQINLGALLAPYSVTTELPPWEAEGPTPLAA